MLKANYLAKLAIIGLLNENGVENSQMKSADLKKLILLENEKKQIP